MRGLLLLGAALWLASVAFNGLVIFARTGKGGEVQDSVTFFGHIAQKRLLEFRRQVAEVSDELLRDDSKMRPRSLNDVMRSL